MCGVLTLSCIAPFLRGIMARGRRSSWFIALWRESRYNRLPLVFTLIVRAVVVCMLVFYIIRFLVPFADPVLLLFALLMAGGIMLSRPLMVNSMRMEKVFMENLHSREAKAQREGKMPPGYADRLLSRESLEEMAGGDGEVAPVLFDPTMDLETGPARSWLRLVRVAVDDIESGGALFRSTLAATHFE